jgi:hypothetical protein
MISKAPPCGGAFCAHGKGEKFVINRKKAILNGKPGPDCQ